MKRKLKPIFRGILLTFLFYSCSGKTPNVTNTEAQSCEFKTELTNGIESIISEYSGNIGVALIVNGKDTLSINNRNEYPMMSVFKLHQGIALCNNFNRKGLKLDSILHVSRSELNPDTWSPMLKEHTEDTIRLSVKDLLRFAITQSDNNASNLMFNRLVSVAETDSMIATIIPRSEFRISYTEEDMYKDHSKVYSNYSTPLGAAELINRLMTDSILTPEHKECISEALMDCQTGQDRIIKPLLDKKCAVIAHKTGSGYRNKEGMLSAHNDVAYIKLTDGQSYSLAVFVKDIYGNETVASEAIARISALVYSFIENHHQCQ